MRIKTKNIISLLLLLPVIILCESLVINKKNHGDCLEITGSTLKSAGPPSCYSGEPPDNTNCTAYGCHDDGIPNTGPALVSLDLGGADNGYILGQTYTVSISVAKSGMLRSGFQAIALEDNNITNSPGTVTLINSTRTQLIDVNHPHPGPCGDQNTKVWVEHTSAGINSVSSGANSWSYLWTAPSSDVGSVTFYLAALESNNSLDETGDNAYTRTKTISVLTGMHDMGLADNEIEIFPNPSEGEFSVVAHGELSQEFSVYDIHEKLLEKFTVSAKKIKLDLREYPKGVYFLKCGGKNSSAVSKLVIQ